VAPALGRLLPGSGAELIGPVHLALPLPSPVPATSCGGAGLDGGSGRSLTVMAEVERSAARMYMGTLNYILTVCSYGRKVCVKFL
jgi:hypothetical protein